MSRFAGRFWAALALPCVLVLGASGRGRIGRPRPTSRRRERRSTCCRPGQAGRLRRRRNSTDQIPLYDGLTPQVRQRHGGRPAQLLQGERVRPRRPGACSATQTFPARPGSGHHARQLQRAARRGLTRDDVMYGIGYVTAEDRALLMDTLRGPGRIGGAGRARAEPVRSSRSSFQPFNSSQADRGLPRHAGRPGACQDPGGQRIVDDVDNYLAGINDYRDAGRQHRPAVEPQRRGRVRGADRRRVRQGRRRRGAPRAAAVGAAGPARRAQGRAGLERPARAEGRRDLGVDRRQVQASSHQGASTRTATP